jgi:hypothetical protein
MFTSTMTQAGLLVGVPDVAVLHNNLVHTITFGVILALAVLAAAWWRRAAGASLLIVPFLLSAILHLEFADPATSVGIELAYGARELARLKMLPFVVGGASLIGFGIGEILRRRRTDMRQRLSVAAASRRFCRNAKG